MRPVLRDQPIRTKLVFVKVCHKVKAAGRKVISALNQGESDPSVSRYPDPAVVVTVVASGM